MNANASFRVRLWSVSLLACLVACSPRPEGSLSQIPSTFTGALDVRPHDRLTKDLYLAIVNLAKGYGMDPRGAVANNGRDWQIQIYCGKQFVGGGTTARDGDLVMFDLAVYGFQQAQDYERFKVELVELMKAYGTVRVDPERPHLSQEELLKRGKHTGFDVTSKCGPGRSR